MKKLFNIPRLSWLLLLAISIQTYGQKIHTLQYWFNDVNTTPTNVAITSNDTVNQVFTIPTTGLIQGFHNLHFRVQDSSGFWSQHQNQFFYVLNANQGINTPGIIGGEYFYDNDPGLGNAVLNASIGSSGASYLINNYSLPITGLAPGFHTFHGRMLDSTQTWGHYASGFFYILDSLGAGNTPQLVDAEFYIDQDPGVGNANPISITVGDTLNQVFNIPATSISTGFHSIHIRIKNSAGIWSHYHTNFFYVSEGAQLGNFSQLMAGEYYIDQDPGIGHGTAFSFAASDSLNMNFQFGAGGLNAGPHTLYVRVQDSLGVYSHYKSIPFNVVACSIPNANFIVVDNACIGDTVVFIDSSSNVSANANYNWDFNNDGATDDTTRGNTSFVFGNPGIYNITLKIAHLGSCIDSVTQAITVLGTKMDTVFSNACNNFTWSNNGNIYSASGYYPDSTQTVLGCDSVTWLNLTINQPNGSLVSQNACNSFTWPNTGLTYTSKGMYYDTLVNVFGCDSVITLDLTINTPTTSTQNTSTCYSYTWPLNNSTYTQTGVYTDTVLNYLGCDSIVTLNLLVDTSTQGNEIITACNSYTWPSNGTTYTITGQYFDTLTNSKGCDSIAILDLTINNTNNSTEIHNACDVYTWGINGLTYTQTGVYFDTLSNTKGCDSIIKLDLTILTSHHFTFEDTSCNKYTWNADGNTYYASGTYITTLTNGSGCDSTLTLNLVINIVDTSVTQTDTTLLANATQGNYQWLYCDSNFLPIPDQNSNLFNPEYNGSYAVEVEQNGCIDTSSCFEIISIGLAAPKQLSYFKVFPNPTDGGLTIKFEKIQQVVNVTIYSIDGKAIKNQKFLNERLIEIEIKGASGNYLLEITDENQNRNMLQVIKR